MLVVKVFVLNNFFRKLLKSFCCLWNILCNLCW